VTGGGSAYETPRIYGQPNYFGTGNTSATCRQVDGTSSGGCTGSKWEAGLAARWNEGGGTNAAFLFVIADCEPQPENAARSGAGSAVPRADCGGVASFPQHPPYGGAYADVIPHLTIAERRLADLPTLLAVERVVQSGLPLTTRIEKVLLIAGTEAPNSWRLVNELCLDQPSEVP
jgi:hypothetical protein